MVLKFLKKVGLTLIYPVMKITVLDAFDSLAGKSTGWLEGLKGIWVEPKKDKK